MYIKLSNDRKVGPNQLIDTINVEKNNFGFLLDLKIKDITNINQSLYEMIIKNVFISFQEIETLFLDFGIVSFSFDFSFNKYTLLQIIPDTIISKKNITKFHEDQNLLPFIMIFSPEKNSKIEDCNVIVRHLNNINTTSNIDYEKQISNLSDFIYNDYCWGEKNYPKILSPDQANVGEKFNFNIENPNSRPIYLESNIGILNKTKITISTNVELDLTNVQETEEDVIIKIGYKYWSGIEEKRIKLL